VDDVGDAEGLARAGHTEQRLVREPGVDALDQLANGFRLIAGGLEAGDELEFGHKHLWDRGSERKLAAHHGDDRKRLSHRREKNVPGLCSMWSRLPRFQGKRPTSGKVSDTVNRLTVKK
jgi:hypothetical protein